MSKALLRRLPTLDNLEMLTVQDYEADFPLHFHDQFCLTLVQRGFECTTIHGKQLLSPVGHISLTAAGEVHANPNLNQGTYSFITYYISPDFLRYLNRGEAVFFQESVIDDPAIFSYLSKAAQKHGQLLKTKQLSLVLEHLVQKYKVEKSGCLAEEKPNAQINEVVDFMEAHLDEKVQLEQLAKMCDQSKFQFLRSFKKNKGIPPTTYLIIKRIEKAKLLLKKGVQIAAVCYDCGFFDQSHFHKYFRKYVGMTPLQYVQACNILQD